MIIFQRVLYWVLFVCLVPSIGISQLDMKSNVKSHILDQVQASRVIQTCEVFNLKGPVKQVQMVAASTQKELLVQKFNTAGQLVRSKTPKQQLEYKFEEGHLERKLVMETAYPDVERVDYYNKKGQLVKEVYTFEHQKGKETTTVTYHYPSGWNKVNAIYEYDFDVSSRDIIEKRNYQLKFDAVGRVQHVIVREKHPEHTYQHTKTYTYEAGTGRLLQVSHVDRDAGSNSALHLILTREYNDSLRTVTESLVDFTVRNAGWSYSGNSYEKRNPKGDVIEKSEASFFDHYTPQLGSLKGDAPQKTAITTYTYVYDKYGNWIKQFVVNGKTKQKIAERRISYYQ